MTQSETIYVTDGSMICLIYSLRSSDVRFRIKYFFAKSDILFQDFIKIATPAVINDVVWSFANSAFAAILGHISDDMVQQMPLLLWW